MSTTCEPQVGNIGMNIILTVKDCDGDVVDISDATTKEIQFKAPNRAVETKTATFTDDGADGKIEWATTSGDLDVSGLYKVQAKVVTPAGTFFSSAATFKVVDNL